MASGPFARPEGGFEIAPVQLRGGFSPTNPNAIVDAVAQGVARVGDVIKERRKTEIEEDIKEQAQSLELALTARAFPKFADQLLAERAKDDPVVKGALREMSDIKLAMEQGVLPHQFALQRLSVIKQNALEAAPEFSDEIVAAVSDISGRDPDRALFSELLSPGKRTLTPAEKAQAELQKESIRTGLPIEVLQEAGRAQVLAQMESNNLKLVNSKGEQLTQGLTRRAQLEVGGVTQRFIGELLAQQQQGGVAAPEELRLMYDSQMQAIITDLKTSLPPGTDPAVLQPTLNQIQQDMDRMHQLIENGNLADIIQNRTDLLISGTRLASLENSPTMLVAASLNPSDWSRGVELVSKAQRMTAGGRALAGEIAPIFQVIGQNMQARQKFFEYYGNLTTKGQVPIQPPTTQQELDVFTVAAREAMKSKDAEVAGNALAQMIEKKGEDFTWATLENREIFLAVDPKSMGPAVENLQRSNTESLRQQFTSLVVLPQFNTDFLKLTATGEIQYQPEAVNPQLQGRDRTRLPQEESPAIRQWVDRYNRTVRISKMYAGAGKINSALFPGGQGYWDIVTKDALEGRRIEQEAAAQGQNQSKPIVWERDENGVPRIRK